METLSALVASHHEPALLGTLLALHERLGNIDTAAATLRNANDEASLEAMAAFLVRYGRWREVAEVQQRRLRSSPRSPHFLASLVVALSHFDAEAANVHLARLEVTIPAAEEQPQIDEFEAKRLEQIGLPRAPKDRADARHARELASDMELLGNEKPKSKRHRHKKTTLPRGFDPSSSSTPPDPERWLPKRERSSYRPRKKDKRLSRGPQGSTTGQASAKARIETNIARMTCEEKAKAKNEQEAKLRAEAAAAAAAAAGVAKKKKKNRG